MKRLNDNQTNVIVELLKKGKPLPEEYRWLLFEGRQETELLYAGKTREVDVLAETMAVPLQKAKVFGEVRDDQWHNMLIFGDNLQILKTLLRMKDEGKLKNPDGTRGVKLIYIDPPFGTGNVYGNGDVAAYSAKLMGAKYLAWLRQRIILLKELLSDDGSLYMRTDYHFGHYMKVLLDEIFDRVNFRNEIIVRRGQAKAGFFKQFDKIKSVAVAYDILLWYSKSPDIRFNKVTKQAKEEHRLSGRWSNLIKAKAYVRPTLRYEILGVSPEPAQWMWSKGRASRAVDNYRNYLEISQQSKESLEEYWERTGKTYEFVRKKNSQIQYWIPPRERELLDNDWLDIKGYSHITDFPTENSEELLERVLQVTNKSEIVLDAFAGSGTTGAVAEKLGRRWIMIDSSKFALYTMTKRLLNLRDRIGNKGKPLKTKPFATYNAGLYNMSMLKELPFKEYREFALQLFQCKDEPHKLVGVELDGYLGQDHVLVFKWKRNSGKKDEFAMDRGFIDDLHSILGDRISKRFFVIAPAASVLFLEDYIEKSSVRYYVLRIPYSVIDELHRKNFKLLQQPLSADISEVNKVMEQVGFDFIYPPNVECEYYVEKEKGKLFDEIVIRIKKFKSNIISKRPIPEGELGLKALSMVMIDYDYNGEYFDMDGKWFASELAKGGHEVRFELSKAGEKMMIVYMDVYGNERKEVKSLKELCRKG